MLSHSMSDPFFPTSEQVKPALTFLKISQNIPVLATGSEIM